MEPQALQQQITASPEETTFLGRDAVRVPATAVREQVLQNNIGAMYLPEEEIAASADQWDFTPVTLGHPTSRGQPISGRDPDALNDYAVGVFADCSVQDGQLKGDVYLWSDRLDEVEGGEDVLEALASRDPVEVSTGFSGEFYHEEDEFGGDSYEVVAQNIGPDHFALLPNGTGACSVEDGCGLGINQSRPDFADTEDIAPDWADGEWGRPNLADHPEADDDDEWSDLSEEDRATIAGRFIEGGADVETYADLGFPVVNPATGNLNRNAVLAARQRGDDTEAGDIADALWDEHFAEDDMEDEGAENLLRRFLNRLEELVDGDVENQDGMSLDDIREAVRDHIDQQFGAQDRFVYIAELFEGEVIYGIDVQGGEDRLFRADYAITEDEEVTLGDRTEVEKVVEFEPVENRLEQRVDYRERIAANEEKEMDQETLIERLAENEDVPYGAEELEAMDADGLQFVANAADLDFEDNEEGAEEEPATNAESEETEEPPAWAEEITNRLEKLEEATEPALEQHRQKRTRLISEVAQNSRFSEEELEDQPVEFLENLRAELKPRDFSGLGGPSRGEPGSDELDIVDNSVMGESVPGN